jgi:ribosomal protein S27AE
MTELQILPFTTRPECPKCGQGRFTASHHGSDGRVPLPPRCEEMEHIHLYCDWCGFQMWMRPRDAGQPR